MSTIITNETAITEVVVVTQGGDYCVQFYLSSFHIKTSNFMH